MRRLLWLYPRDWRRRYGAEMEALLRQWGRPGPRQVLDLLRGAVDAHLHPQWRRRRWWGWRWLAVPVVAVLAAQASEPVMRDVFDVLAGRSLLRIDLTSPFFPPGQWQSVGTVAVLWLLAALAARWLGARFLAWFCALLALRFAAEWLLMPVVLGVARGLPYAAEAGTVAVVWAAFAAVALRRTRRAWPVAVVAGCLLELLLGSSGYSASGLLEQRLYVLSVLPAPSGLGPHLPPLPFPLHLWNFEMLGFPLETLRITLWAALLAALAGRRRRRPWAEPPEGAPVTARPAPDPPQPLEARARRAS
jgi:hypothetical protein